MTIWSGEIKELEKLYEVFKGHLPDIVKELEQLIKTQDPNVVMLYSRRCLEVIITDLCENELKRPRKTEPLKGIIDKLGSEEKVPSHIVTSMHSLNSLATFGTHPKDFDPEQVKPVLINLAVIIRWYLKYKDFKVISKNDSVEKEYESIDYGISSRVTNKQKKRYLFLFYGLILIIFTAFIILLVKKNHPGKQIPVEVRDTPFTFNINSEFGNINDSIKLRLVQDGYTFTAINPDYTIDIISGPPGDPVAVNGSAAGFYYIYDSADVLISINKQTPFGIGVTVPKTAPKLSFQEAKAEYRKNYYETLIRNFEEVYSQIKKHAPKK